MELMRCNAIEPKHNFQAEGQLQRKECIEIYSTAQFNGLVYDYPRLGRVKDLVHQLLKNKPRLYLTMFFEEIKCATCQDSMVFLEGFVLVNE
jgi:hypothetical protein